MKESENFEQDDTLITKRDFFDALNELEERLVKSIREIGERNIATESSTQSERSNHSDGQKLQPKKSPTKGLRSGLLNLITPSEKEKDGQRNGGIKEPAALEETEKEIKRLKENLQGSAKAVDERDQKIQQLEEKNRQLENEKGELTAQKSKSEEESEAREQELRSTIKRIEEAYKKQEEETEKERAAKEEANKHVDRLKGELEQSKEQIQNLRRNLEEIKFLQDRICPSFLRDTEGLATFIEEWGKELVAERPNKDLIFMFANIFTWSCAFAIEKDGGGDDIMELTATTALWNFSRALLRWLYAHGKTSEEAFLIISKLSEAVNNIMQGGRYMTEVPTLDSPYSSKNMDYSADGSSVGSVAAIVAWGIRSTSSNICKKKSIVKLTN